MSFARKLTLLAVLAVAAATGAPSVLAQFEPLPHNQTPRLIVQQEVHAANDVNCPGVVPAPVPDPGPLVTNGGCRAHLTSSPSSIAIVHHPTAGAEFGGGVCGFEADVRIDSSGEGYLSHQELTGGGCPVRACGQVTPPTSEGRAWSFYMRETEPAPREQLILLLCLEYEPGGMVRHCEFTLPLSQLSTHRYRAAMTDAVEHNPLYPSCEFTGALDFEVPSGVTGEAEARQSVEIRHT